MFINVLSRHLPAAVSFISTRVGDRVLEFVHLIEMARYHQTRVRMLCEGYEKVPPDFNSGTDITGPELDLHWRGMTAVFELEAFLLAVKRSLDAGWRCSRDVMPELLSERTRRMHTFGGAIHKIDEMSRGLIAKHASFDQLVTAWEEWGQEAVQLRNFFEHDAPLGGRTAGAFISPRYNQSTATVILPLPDEVKRGTDKRNLQFTQGREAVRFSGETMARLDELCDRFLPSILKLPRDHTGSQVFTLKIGP